MSEEMPSIKKEMEKLEDADQQKALHDRVEKSLEQEEVVEWTVVGKKHTDAGSVVSGYPLYGYHISHYPEGWSLEVQHEDHHGYVSVSKEEYDQTEEGAKVEAPLNQWQKEGYGSEVKNAVAAARDFESLAKALRSMGRIETQERAYDANQIDALIDDNIQRAIKTGDELTLSFIPEEFGIREKVRMLAQEHQKEKEKNSALARLKRGILGEKENSEKE